LDRRNRKINYHKISQANCRSATFLVFAKRGGPGSAALFKLALDAANLGRL
jgi:hypothetical protein